MKNLARILAECPKEQYRFIRVLNNTLNVTNGSLLIRRFAQLPDGVYQVDLSGALRQVEYPFGMSYPDIEMIKPDFNQMKPWCQLTKDLVGHMMVLCSQVKDFGGTVVIEQSSIFMRQNPEIRINYAFNLPEPASFNPKYLEIILREMLTYDFIFLLRKHNPGQEKNSESPVIFGKNWGSCALIMPLKAQYDNSDGGPLG